MRVWYVGGSDSDYELTAEIVRVHPLGSNRMHHGHVVVGRFGGEPVMATCDLNSWEKDLARFLQLNVTIIERIYIKLVANQNYKLY
jgi:hypothetical protein